MLRVEARTPYDRAVQFLEAGNIEEALLDFGVAIYSPETHWQESLFCTIELVKHGKLPNSALNPVSQGILGHQHIGVKAGLFTGKYRLAEDSEDDDFATVRIHHFSGLNTAEKTCIYALAWYHKQDFTKARQFAGLFLNKFYDFSPSQIPSYLRPSFIAMLTHNIPGTSNIGHWQTRCMNDAREVKKQFLAVICSLKDARLKQMALWQALYPPTFLGQIFYIKCGVRFPDISNKKSQLENVLKALTDTLMESYDHTIHIDEFTKNGLLGDQEFMNKLREFPVVYNALTKPIRQPGQRLRLEGEYEAEHTSGIQTDVLRRSAGL